MSTSPITSSSGYGFPPPELPDDAPPASTQGSESGDGTEAGAPREGPRGGREDMGDRAVPLGTVAGNRPPPGNAGQAGMVHRDVPPNGQPPSGQQGAAPDSASAPRGPAAPGGAERPPPPDRGSAPPDRAQGSPNAPGNGNGQQNGFGNANSQSPGAAQMPGSGNPNHGPGNGPGAPGNNGQGWGNQGNGYGNNGAGNHGGLVGGITNGIGNLLGGLLGGNGGALGNNGSLLQTLPSLISSQSLSGTAFGTATGTANALVNALPVSGSQAAPGVNPQSVTMNSQVPAASTTGNPASAQTSNLAQPSTPAQHSQPTQTTGTMHGTSAAPSAQTMGFTQATTTTHLLTNTPVAARPVPVGSATDATHPTAAAGAVRGSVADLVAQPNAGVRNQAMPEPLNANGMQTAGGTQTAAARQAGQVVQAVTAQSGLLTLVMAPQVQPGNDEGSVTHQALFRGQNAEGQENIRDILGRSYVFNAEGKLTTRAEERRSVDAIGAREANEISESSASTHGELSTHELVWKVVAPALVGVGALLGGATAGAAAAAGSSGIASAFLLTAATAIFGYGATRGALALRAMADAGESVNPIENRAASKQWLATGSQSVGGLASLAAMFF